MMNNNEKDARKRLVLHNEKARVYINPTINTLEETMLEKGIGSRKARRQAPITPKRTDRQGTARSSFG